MWALDHADDSALALPPTDAGRLFRDRTDCNDNPRSPNQPGRGLGDAIIPLEGPLLPLTCVGSHRERADTY